MTATPILRTERYLTLSQACEAFNLAPSTLRLLCDSGNVSGVLRTAGGHRRIPETSLREALGADQAADGGVEQGKDDALPVALICRVSSNKQTHRSSENVEASSFDYQRERLLEFVRTDERFRGKRLRIKHYDGKGVSGLNFSAKHLTSLIGDILSGKFNGGFIVATDPSRLLRFGADLLATIAEANGAAVIYSHPQEGDDDLTTDILNILTHYTAKASGRKGAAILRKQLSDEVLSESFKLHRSGVSMRAIFLKLKAEGRNRCERTGKEFSYRTLNRAFHDGKAILDKAIKDDGAPNSFVQWAKHSLSRKKEGRLNRSSIIKSYRLYCKEQGITAISPQSMVTSWQSMGGKIIRQHNYTTYCGFVFKGDSQ